MITKIPKAIKRPPKPPTSRPKFHPEKSPEITAATASPQRPKRPAARVSWRFSKYPSSGFLYVTPETFMCSEAIRFPIRRFGISPRGSRRLHHGIVIGCFPSNFRPLRGARSNLWPKEFCLPSEQASPPLGALAPSSGLT